jgi:predicted Ser/Thr protein kinase
MTWKSRCRFVRFAVGLIVFHEGLSLNGRILQTDDYIISLLGEPIIQFDVSRHQSQYTVGVLAIRDDEETLRSYNTTFQSYLSETVGKQFYPPISFDIKAFNISTLYEALGTKPNRQVDFVYVSPSVQSCIEAEFGVKSVVSQISKHLVGNEIYELDEFGGVMFTKSDNNEINTIHDIKGKVIAATSISTFDSGQLQFVEMIKMGMSYINDPKQIIFTSNPELIVTGVLSGEFSVGFVRTGQLETTKDDTGSLINASIFKIINEIHNVKSNGKLFPFARSTKRYPEWNIGVLDHVSDDVIQMVQRSLLLMKQFSQLNYSSSEDESTDDNFFNRTLIPDVARNAMLLGQYAGWRTSLSYVDILTIQEMTGFAQLNLSTGSWTCTRPTSSYDAVVCPVGYFASVNDIKSSCTKNGLDCKEGYQCICTPCQPNRICQELEINGRCISFAVFLPLLLAPVFLLIVLMVHFYVEYKRKQADSVWLIKTKELIFAEPTPVIGKGSFGVVLLGEYRGTAVAVKRAISFCPSHHFATIPSNMSDSMSSFGGGTMTKTKVYGVRCFQSNQSRRKAEFVREMRLLSKLRHPCITTVMGAVLSKYDEPTLVMEYMEHGSLYDLLRNKSFHLDYFQRMGFLKDIIQGIRFLHAAMPVVVHGDLKVSAFRFHYTVR